MSRGSILHPQHDIPVIKLEFSHRVKFLRFSVDISLNTVLCFISHIQKNILHELAIQATKVTGFSNTCIA
jgi:hypothetical protein